MSFLIGRSRTARETYPQSPGAGGNGATGAFLATPASGTGAQLVASGFEPQIAGKLLAVVDITPQKSGILLLSATLEVVASLADTPNVAVYYVDALTGVVGGTVISPAGVPGAEIVATPTSTTPAFGTGSIVFESDNTVSSAGQTIVLANVPIRAVEGHRTLIAIVGLSSSNTITWTVSGQIVCSER